MLKKKYYDGFTVHDILSKHLDDGHKILELLTAFAEADGVDAVPVIRCKDCKYWQKSSINYNEYVCYWGGYVKQEDDYCSWAERREE